MRVLMQVEFDTERSNEAIRSGTIEKSLQSAMEMLHPEAAYFGPLNGCRTAFLVCDLANPSDMPKVTEPFFQDFGATVRCTPVMNVEDLHEGLAALG
ncbi:DUF3303 family protein [Streptomyces sp. NPDC006733]|uniref:DUF3303 family protein n=1 Tax=Streptomyces sp. NPDC006733 TaxID=3155460 RepID=UPI0033CE76A9